MDGYRKRLRRGLRNLGLFLGLAYLAVALGCAACQRTLLYYPGHSLGDNGLTAWVSGTDVIGYCQIVPEPQVVWLMCHGNGGQASDRGYAIPHFSSKDSVYILEYPGYGLRAGKPSRTAFNQAASQAYEQLRKAFPSKPVCVVGESIGTGPACSLAGEAQPPDKIVLIVPFDNLASVAQQHMPFLPVRLLLEDRWDNAEAMRAYRGPVDIFGAENDQVIPVQHARALAATLPQAKFHLLFGGHNDWSRQPMEIRYP